MPVNLYHMIRPELILLLPLVGVMAVYIRRITQRKVAGKLMLYLGAGMLGFAVSLAYTLVYDLPTLAVATGSSLLQGGIFALGARKISP